MVRGLAEIAKLLLIFVIDVAEILWTSARETVRRLRANRRR